MVREIWYRHLAIADRLIVEARDCIDNQKQHLSVLEQDGEDISRAVAQLHLRAVAGRLGLNRRTHTPAPPVIAGCPGRSGFKRHFWCQSIR